MAMRCSCTVALRSYSPLFLQNPIGEQSVVKRHLIIGLVNLTLYCLSLKRVLTCVIITGLDVGGQITVFLQCLPAVCAGQSYKNNIGK